MINNENDKVKIFKNILVMFDQLKNNYLYRQGLTVVDRSPFQDFTYNCIGMPLDTVRLMQIEEYSNNNTNCKNKYMYKPTK